jgi:hypothetical protein
MDGRVRIGRARRLLFVHDILVVRLASVFGWRSLRSRLLTRLAVVLGCRSRLPTRLVIVLRRRLLRSRRVTRPGRPIAERPARIGTACASGAGYVAAPRERTRFPLLRVACRERRGNDASDGSTRLVAVARLRQGSPAQRDRHGHERRRGKPATAECSTRQRRASGARARSGNRGENGSLERDSRGPHDPSSQPAPPAAYRVTVCATARAIVEVTAEPRAPQRRPAQRGELLADLGARRVAGITACAE